MRALRGWGAHGGSFAFSHVPFLANQVPSRERSFYAIWHGFACVLVSRSKVRSAVLPDIREISSNPRTSVRDSGRVSQFAASFRRHSLDNPA
jgi:hypothetical protein